MNNNNFDKKKVAVIILAILMIVWTVASVLSFGIFVKDCTEVKADSVEVGYTYESGNIFVPTGQLTRSAVNGQFATNINLSYLTGANSNLNFRMQISSQRVLMRSVVNITFVYSYSGASYEQLQMYDYNGRNITDSGLMVNESENSPIFTNPAEQSAFTAVCFLGYLNGSSTLTNRYEAFVAFFAQPLFNCNVVQIDYNSVYLDNSSNSLLKGAYVCNYITYTDFNGYKLWVCFYAAVSERYLPSASFTPRTYYLDNSSLTDASYQEGFLAGQNEGYQSGYEQGKTDGLKTGTENGYNNGYYEGRRDGIASANDYTFLGLLGAVVDAPLQALRGLLNFNLLGFNMANFFFALITLALIIMVIRLVL